MAIETTGWRQPAHHASAILAAALALCWPALWIGYPLLNTDCITYLRDGHRILLLLFTHSSLSNENTRSTLYCAGIYLLHWNRSPWPVLIADALLTAWTVWLVARSLCLRPLLFLTLIAVLALFSTAPWSVALISPDILGPVVYLSMYLLIFARATLRRWETILLAVVTLWAVSSHPTHMLLAMGLCAFLGVLGLAGWHVVTSRWRHLLQVSALVALGVAMQAAANARIYGTPSLVGPQPPYLMARIIADGPSRQYLQDHCSELRWQICNSVQHLPSDESDFLWTKGGIYDSASPQQRLELKSEEMPLILGTLRSHPRRQLVRSLSNFAYQLADFGIDDATENNPWMIGYLDSVLPGSRSRYLHSRLKESALPRALIRHVQQATVVLSVLTLIALLPWLWRRHPARFAALAGVCLFIVLANAFVTGVLSGIYSRYEGRVIWLLPLLALLALFLRFSSSRQNSRIAGAA
jgi:hypothetical protein